MDLYIHFPIRLHGVVKHRDNVTVYMVSMLTAGSVYYLRVRHASSSHPHGKKCPCIERYSKIGSHRVLRTGYYDVLHAQSQRNHSSILGKNKWIFSSSQRPDRLWGSPSLLSNGYRGLCPLE
jgi:hypothetical protein